MLYSIVVKQDAPKALHSGSDFTVYEAWIADHFPHDNASTADLAKDFSHGDTFKTLSQANGAIWSVLFYDDEQKRQARLINY